MASYLIDLNEIKTEKIDLNIVKKEPQEIEYFQNSDKEIKQEVNELGAVKKENVTHEEHKIKQECLDLGVSQIKNEQPKFFETTIDSDIGGITLKILGENGTERRIIISVNMDGTKYFYEGYVGDIGKGEITLEKVCKSEETIKQEEEFIKLNESNLSRIKRWLELSIYSCLEKSGIEDYLSNIGTEVALDFSLPKATPVVECCAEIEEEPRMNDTKAFYKVRMPHIEVYEHEIEEMMKKTRNPKMARYHARRHMTPEEREKQDKNNLAARRSRAKEKIRDVKYTAFLNDPNRGVAYGDYKTVKKDKDSDKDATSNGDKDCPKKKKPSKK